MNKRKRFNQILKGIKSIKIQGAENIAKKALEAYFLFPTLSSKKKILSLRPTEPLLMNVLNKLDKESKADILDHFNNAQDKINKLVYKIIKNNDRIFTHCHSSSVISSLIHAKKKGKKFEVYNTETRPLFQGRRTAIDLRKAGIKITTFIDAASLIAIGRESKKDKTYATKIFLGADALLKEGIINKIGSGMIAEIAKDEKVPVYIIADSWKFTRKKVPIEQRKPNEIWSNAPKRIFLKNPAFEFVPKRDITAIVSEKGILKYDKFLKRIN